MAAGDDVLKEQDAMANERRKEEPAWEELAALLRPDDQDFEALEDRGREDTDLYDSTPLYALDNFVGGMFGQSVNPATRWMEIGVEDPDLAKWGPVRKWSYHLTNLVFSSCGPSVSAFYSRAPAWLANLGAFGLGPFYSEERDNAEGFNDIPIPIGQTYLRRDASGNYNRFHRMFPLTGAQIKKKWGDRVAGVRDDATYKIVHSVFENPDYRPGAFGQRGFPWYSCYVSHDVRSMRIEKGYYEFPYHITAWNERARSHYPTGPGHNARADAGGLQEMERSNIVATQFDAEPPLLLRSEEVLTAADVTPNAALYGTMSDQGKRLAEWLERKGDMSRVAQQSAQRRDAIRQAFYYGLMQVAMSRPQMTATEFLGLQEETLKLMAPNLARVQTGGLSSFIVRRYRMLDRAGQIPPPPPELNGRRMQITYISPLAKVQMLADARGVLRLHQSIEAMAVTDPNVRDKFDADVAADTIAPAFSSVPGIIRDDAEVAKIRQLRAAQQAEQLQLAQAGQAVSIAAEASHAEQAATLAKLRTKAA